MSSETPATTRAATHANSWYAGNKTTLNTQLDDWLNAVGNEINGVGMLPPEGARVIIAPHAGYSYSGPAAAWAYRCLDLSKVKRVFILGPSHRVYMNHCALSKCNYYATPLGNLTLDTQTLSQLHQSHPQKFTWMDLTVDEEEHSIEMHLPYIYKLLQLSNNLENTKIVPIMVGAIDRESEVEYGNILADYVINQENLFVISSDFCHWGTRFKYTHYYTDLPSQINSGTSSIDLDSRSKISANKHRIYESIEALDTLGMSSIETGFHEKFSEYLTKTNNTICGRHPISVIMAAIECVERKPTHDGVQREKVKFKFVRYEQSNKVREPNDSSVSYASAFAIV